MRVVLSLLSKDLNFKLFPNSAPLELSFALSLADIISARAEFSKHLKDTPFFRSEPLSALLGTNLYLKDETSQPTRSFKIRGALAKMSRLTPEECRRGVVAASGGNHGQGVAYAASLLGMNNPPPLIFAPKAMQSHYFEAMRKFGAEIRFQEDLEAALTAARRCEREEGRVFIHPYDDPGVVAGQGTLGLELLSEAPHLTDVVCSIGGGGLMVGTGVAVKSLNPEIRLWAVETVGADTLARSLAAGRLVRLEKITSQAKTLGVHVIPERNFEFAQAHLEGKKVTVVSDAEAIHAQRLLYEHHGMVTELAASCTLAAAKSHLPFGPQHHVALVVCGGNPPETEIQALQDRKKESDGSYK